MRLPVPIELDSVFGPTHNGVPNPIVAQESGYPTRYHGPVWNMPQQAGCWRSTTYRRAPFLGFGSEDAGQSLKELSLYRAELPKFGPPDATIPQQLEIAWKECRSILKRYVGDFRFSPEQSEAVVHRIGAWVEANGEALRKMMQDPSSSALPDTIKLQLGSEAAKQYILAIYTEAARGLGPWLSGQVGDGIAKNQLSEESMREDATARLTVFAGIVKLERDGDLAKIFMPEAFAQKAVQGLGAGIAVPVGVLIAIVVVLVATAAIFAVWSIYTEKLRLSNKLQAELCKRAFDEKYEPGMSECIKTTADLQDSKDPISSTFNLIVMGATVVGVAYIGARFVAPAIFETLSKK